jgi:putative hemolysin
MFLEIIIILSLILTNGIFSMSEIALVSARKARLQQAAEEGDNRARAALELARSPTGFLATVQIGITLAGILAGAFGGATFAEAIAAAVAVVPAVAPYSEAVGVVSVVIIITYLSLVLGELVPKRLALTNPERVAAAIAEPMRVLATVAHPLVRFLSISTDLVTSLLGIRQSNEPAITPEELRILIEQGTQTGIFEEAEQDMIEGVLGLDERRVDRLMTPRTQIVWLDVDDPPETLRTKIESSGFSRFPACQGNSENVLGIVRAKELLVQAMACQPLDLRSILQPALFVPETTTALRLLELFREHKRHIALVTDEFGSIQGLVTHNDLLEAVVGAMPGPGEIAEPGAVQREDGTWLMDGLLPVDLFKGLLGIEDELPGEDQGVFQTLGGFAMHQIGAVPVAGQTFIWQHFHFEVLDMDGRRVDKLLVRPVEMTADRERTTDNV